MSNGPRRRKNNNTKNQNIGAKRTKWDKMWKTGKRPRSTSITWYNWFVQFMIAPFDRYAINEVTGKVFYDGPKVGPTIAAALLEFTWSLVLALLVTAVRAAAAGPSAILDGLCIGLVYGGVFYVAWRWTKEYQLKHHLNWAITLGYVGVGDVGIITWIGYAICQFGGAMVGGVIAGAFGFQAIPNPSIAAIATTDSGAAWLEFLGSLLLVLAIVYIDKHEDDDEKEDANHERSGQLGGLILLTYVTAFYSKQSYNLGNVVYIGGLFSMPNIAAASTTGFTSLTAWMVYLGLPIAGGAFAMLIFFIVWVLYYLKENKFKREDRATDNDPDKEYDDSGMYQELPEPEEKKIGRQNVPKLLDLPPTM